MLQRLAGDDKAALDLVEDLSGVGKGLFCEVAGSMLVIRPRKWERKKRFPQIKARHAVEGRPGGGSSAEFGKPSPKVTDEGERRQPVYGQPLIFSGGHLGECIIKILTTAFLTWSQPGFCSWACAARRGKKMANRPPPQTPPACFGTDLKPQSAASSNAPSSCPRTPSPSARCRSG